MKFIYFVCALAVFIAGASAQTSCAARKMHADILSIRDQWADEISTLNTCTLDKLHQSMECYLKSYISQRDQLKSLMQGFSVDTNFTVNYQLLTLNSHIKAVQLDLDEGITRNRFKESSSRNFDLNMESALVNFETMEKAADGNPGLAKCWNDFRDECVALHKKIFVEENPGIFAKNINELSEKLQVIVKEADANVAKITHDLCACKGDGASACINQYVSKNRSKMRIKLLTFASLVRRSH